MVKNATAIITIEYSYYNGDDDVVQVCNFHSGSLFYHDIIKYSSSIKSGELIKLTEDDIHPEILKGGN